MSAPGPLRLTTIFTKRPAPGAVKTRLSPPLAPAAAAELALAMLDDTVAQCAAEQGFETRLRIAPAAELAWFRARYPEVPANAQAGDGLGARLAAHFAAHLAGTKGASPQRVTSVVIGSDAPHLGVERIHAAHAALERGADLVLGPDEGGGYHLVGLAQAVPELFTEIAMSTDDMCARTVTLARSRGLAVELLETGFDVDTPDDLKRLARLVRGSAAPPREGRETRRATLSETARVLARLVPVPEPR